MSEDDERIRCPSCGETLVDAADGRDITVNGRTFPFSRSTDYILCGNCGEQVPAEVIHGRQERWAAEQAEGAGGREARERATDD